MTLSEVAVAAGLARPTARRLLLTLAELGYVRVEDGAYALTPRVLGLGTAYTSSLGLWEMARPHLEALVHQTGESSSMAQLDGSDIVYVARVAVPKIIALRVDIGTRFPAERTSQGKVLLAALPECRGRARRGRAVAVRAAAGAGAAAQGPAAGADPGPRPGVGAGRRGAGTGRPLGGGAGAGRVRAGTGSHERHGARRGDVDRAPARPRTCRGCSRRRAGSAATGPPGATARRSSWSPAPDHVPHFSDMSEKCGPNRPRRAHTSDMSEK